jgi:hypothetical protein
MSAIKIIGKLNPKQYSEMLDHLTRKKIKNPFIKAKDIVVDKKPEVEQTEMFNRFNRANPRQDMAGGGMLVQPSADGSRPGYSSESAKRAVLRLPDEGEIDLDKLAKRHNVSAATIGGYRDRNKPNLKSVKKTTRGPRTSGAKYEKRVKVKNYLKNLPDNSNITVLDLADDLKVSRSLIDNILKEKEFKKKKFNLLKKAGSTKKSKNNNGQIFKKKKVY